MTPFSDITLPQRAISEPSCPQTKRRRLNYMDPHIHNAYLARLEEPDFCPRTIIALTPSYPYPLDYHSPGTVPWDGPSYQHAAGRSTTSAFPERGRGAGDHLTATFRNDPGSSTAPTGSRATGFGFEGGNVANSWIGDHVRALSTFPTEPHHAIPSASGTRNGIDHRMNDTVPAPPPQQVSAVPRSDEHGQQSGATQSAQIPHDDAMDIGIDEDALDVDDPRRSYDFATFMDDWRLLSSTHEHVGPFCPGSQPSVRLKCPSDFIAQEELDGRNTDMQGLCWGQLGPDREDALATRRQLHPSRRHEAIKQPQTPIWHFDDRQASLYNFRSFHPMHKAHPSHYQLRNVLTASGRSQIFYATRYQIMQTSLACPNVKAALLDLASPSRTEAPVRITCLSTPTGLMGNHDSSTNVLIAGGFSGEFAMLDLSSEQPQLHIEGFVSHAYNGIVNHISTSPNRRSGLLEATFSSNDRIVRTMDIKTQIFTQVSTYNHAMNCSAISPDARLRILVGDSNETIISDADNGDPLVTLTEHSDHAFACAWSPTGSIVATGAQDGKVVLWDARNWSAPLRTFEARMSCARSLHFTDDGSLVAAESEDVVSIYHPQNLEQRQDIRFFGSIAGVTLLDGGEEMVVANADQTVGGLFSFRRASRESACACEYWNFVDSGLGRGGMLSRDVYV